MQQHKQNNGHQLESQSEFQLETHDIDCINDVIDFEYVNRDIKYSDYSKLVVKVAHDFIKKNNGMRGFITVDDLISEGWIVFQRVLKRFDPSRGIKFSTYLYSALENRFKAVINKEVERNFEFTNYEYLYGYSLEERQSRDVSEEHSPDILESECVIKNLKGGSKEVFKEIQNNPEFYRKLSKKHNIDKKAEVISDYFNISMEDSVDVLKNLITCVGAKVDHKNVLPTSEYLNNYL